VGSLDGFTGDVSLSLAGLSESQANWSFDPPVVAGGSGTAQLTITTAATIAADSYQLTVTGTNGPITHASSASLVVIPPPDFGITVTPSLQTAVAGNGVSYSVTVSSLNGFDGDVTLSMNGLPADVGTSTFSPPVVEGSGSAQLIVTTTTAAATGSYTLTVAGASGTTTHTASIMLVVSAPADFALTVSPSSMAVYRTQSASYTVSVGSVGGFTGNVSLSVSGRPSGSLASFSPKVVTAPGTSTLTVKTMPKTARGTFALRITGTSGSLVHQATVMLIVQ
jgi:hypothetical protein